MPITSTNMRGTPSARSADSSRAQGVVSVTSSTSEIDVATRMVMIAAAVSPWRVSPRPNGSGTTISPGVTTLSVAGSTMMPVKIGMNSHTRLTKKPSGSRDARGQHERADVRGDQHRDVVDEPDRDQQADQRQHLRAGVEPLQQPGACARRPP